MRIKYKKGNINLEGSRKKKQKVERNKDYCWIAKIWKRQEAEAKQRNVTLHTRFLFEPETIGNNVL